MLGEKFYEVNGKTTGVRVVQGVHGHQTEVSFQGVGKLKGVETSEVGTYVAELRQGVFHGVGNGIVVTKDGDSVSWKGIGVGKPSGKGMGAVWRASITYETNAQKLNWMNSVVGVVEWEVDENGNSKGGVWEWK